MKRLKPRQRQRIAKMIKCNKLTQEEKDGLVAIYLAGTYADDAAEFLNEAFTKTKDWIL